MGSWELPCRAFLQEADHVSLSLIGGQKRRVASGWRPRLINPLVCNLTARPRSITTLPELSSWRRVAAGRRRSESSPPLRLPLAAAAGPS